MTRFRPCIDLHQGEVKQIVGGTLNTADPSAVATNHVSPHSADWFASLYRRHQLHGGHLIRLGGGNDVAARAACAAWPDALAIGGGITLANARDWLHDRTAPPGTGVPGAEKVIVTSWLFPDHQWDLARLVALAETVGRDRLVVDLSCRRAPPADPAAAPTWHIAVAGWQVTTSVALSEALIAAVAPYCSELLVHAADVEGLCRGIDEALVARLAEWCASEPVRRAIPDNTADAPLACTYAGGARHLDDVALVQSLSAGRIDVTLGSCLDIFGGTGVRFEDAVQWNQEHADP
ncbi:hypothetical protein CXG81DRAFT_30256 [Caulochytrium protostelioides]|uniref:1-(5-phosphoribosyl)-5-[(5-phosphoribosylamino)methylideneamino] imidazole-4-carboxamide isomerase n=1 Tax=Caulochytrium protostelioides TaxID=1555241 RepID=A0A4V1ITS6_9FUNG|nr:Phosphoribosylformimino-5-aminoimidazole carboxamide ribotide isomerase [Caulochytrium protostelioides]RKO99249.1 hypothetical protein CXG81DRAFT_30256 [Caulochytrium protostelioides]|eukprot:RKO99249.1 hypothetical protein CXG81DRAFT_30256 [Caulochytrium protostelioides]